MEIIEKSYKSNNFKISSALTWNEDFKLPNGSYSVSDIQNIFDYIMKMNINEKVTDNPLIMIYVN